MVERETVSPVDRCAIYLSSSVLCTHAWSLFEANFISHILLWRFHQGEKRKKRGVGGGVCAPCNSVPCGAFTADGGGSTAQGRHRERWEMALQKLETSIQLRRTLWLLHCVCEGIILVCTEIKIWLPNRTSAAFLTIWQTSCEHTARETFVCPVIMDMSRELGDLQKHGRLIIYS